MTISTPAGPEEQVYHGKIIEVIRQPMNIGDKVIYFEKARRAPGTRTIIVRGNSVLLTREYRSEIDAYDYRLPGGKVYDTLAEFQNASIDKGAILKAAMSGAIKECLEETGLVVKDLELLKVSHAGATIEWDLYYFLAKNATEHHTGQSLEDGEFIEPKWFTFVEAKKLCMEGNIREDRTLGVLMVFLEQQLQ